MSCNNKHSSESYSWQRSCVSGMKSCVCSCTWTIENFSFLVRNTKYLVNSHFFRCCIDSDCTWRMTLCPSGFETLDNTLLYLIFSSRQGMTLHANITIYIRKFDNRTLLIREGNCSIKKGKECQTGFILLTYDQMKQILTKDILKIHAELSIFVQKDEEILQGIKYISFSSTETIFEKCSLNWEILNFFNIREFSFDTLSSKTFSQGEDSKWIWHLELKKERKQDNKKCTEIIVELIADKKPDNLPIQYKIAVKNSSNKTFKTFSDKVIDVSRRLVIGDEEELLNNFKDGSIKIQAQVLAVTGMVNAKNFTMIPHHANSTLTESLANMLGSGKHSEVDIFVEQKKIPAHKAMLAIRSPVFDSMFHHDTLEKQEGTIKITDFSFDTVMHVLRFVYTNKFTPEDDDSVIEVLRASDKYQIDDLKKMCEDYLILNLNTCNAKEILSYAETYQALRLKEEALNFVNLHIDDFILPFRDS